MQDKDMECLDKDQRMFSEITEILRVLTNAEKRGQELTDPLKHIEIIVNDADDEVLLNIYPRLLSGLQTGTTDEQTWADDYLTFILRLCELLNGTKTKVTQRNQNSNIKIPLIPA